MGRQTVLGGCIFEDNIASSSEPGRPACGGAIYSTRYGFTARNCIFTRNGAEAHSSGSNYACGGALFFDQVNSALVIGCTFSDNSSLYDGGAVFNSRSSPWYVNCTFIANNAHGDGYALGGGAMFNKQDGETRVVNSIFVGNSATGFSAWSGGGAIHNAMGSCPIVSNSVFVANAAQSRGGAILSTMWSVAHVRNCILWGNSAGAASGELAQIDAAEGDDSTTEAAYCCIEGWTGLLGDVACFGDDPLFVDPVGPDGTPGTGDEDFRLAPGSPCIDRGSNRRVSFDRQDVDGDGDTDELIPIDFEGAGRFFDDPNTPDNACADAAIVDLGAYEVGGTGPQPCHPDVTADGRIDLADLGCLLSVYGCHHTDPRFNPCCDLIVDGTIELQDLAELLSYYGATCP